MELPGDHNTPEAVHNLSDRDLLEAVYRAVYGEEPVHAGLATRVRRLEIGYWVLVGSVIVGEGLRIFAL